MRHPPDMRNGAPGHHTGNAAATPICTPTKKFDRSQSNSKNREIPVVTAEAFPPAGRRSMWLHLVRRCCYCSCAHAHRGAPRGGLRDAGCGHGAYWLRPAVAHREAA